MAKVVNQDSSIDNSLSNYKEPLLFNNYVDKTHVDICWQNLNVNVIQKNGQKLPILKNLTGCVKHGQLLSIMGPSGAGKSTMIGLITQKLQGNQNYEITGKITANNQQYTPKQFNKFGSVVTQNDILMDVLTVRETLEFSAKMRLNYSHEQTQNLVNQVIRQLNLVSCQNTLVGGVFVKGCSGGERKRVCIAVELLSDPEVLVLDEPTSGLDSFTAVLICHILNYKKTVIMTVHQPSSEIFQLFDGLLLLKEGEIAYQGQAKQVVPYMKQLGISIGQYSNIPDIFMHYLKSDMILQSDKGSFHESPLNNNNYIQYLEKSQLENYGLQPIFQALGTNLNEIPQISQKKYTKSWYFEIKSVLARNWIYYKRQPMLFKGRTISYTFFAFLMVSLYWRIGFTKPSQPQPNTPGNENLPYIMNLSAFLYVLGVGMIQTAMMPTLVLFPSQRELFLKEENSGVYRVSSYYLGRTLLEIPFSFILVLYLCALVYFISGLSPGLEHFSIFFLIMFLINMNGSGLGIMSGSLFDDVRKSIAFAPALLMPMQMFGGFFVNQNTFLSWIAWMKWVTPFSYFFEALARNEFTDNKFINVVQGVELEFDVMAYLGLDKGMWPSIYVLTGMAVLFNILAMVFLKLLVKRINA